MWPPREDISFIICIYIYIYVYIYIYTGAIGKERREEVLLLYNVGGGEKLT